MKPVPSPASIVVPAFREAPNLKPLTERLFAALTATGREAELIIVDDNSQDGTEEIVAELAATFPIRVIVRRDERGLSSAVLTGLREARFDRFVVLDADLQHPPEAVPAILDRLEREDTDFVIGTRYGGDGGIAGDWPVLRRLASWTATRLARPLAPLSDPMSGFFALTRETFERADRLDPIGYKIALELYVKAHCHSPGEVPIQFDTRSAGESKFSVGEQVRYVRHLWRLYCYRYPGFIWACGGGAILAITTVICVVGLQYARAKAKTP